jgi:hypothetical protein
MNENYALSIGSEETYFPGKKSNEYKAKIKKQFIAFQNKKMKRK